MQDDNSSMDSLSLDMPSTAQSAEFDLALKLEMLQRIGVFGEKLTRSSKTG